MRKLLGFLVVISVAHANPWPRGVKETSCEFSISRSLGSNIFRDSSSFKASNFSEHIVFRALDSKVRAMRAENAKRNEALLEVERSCGVSPIENTQRHMWNEYYKAELHKIDTNHKEYLVKLGDSIEHALYHFSPVTLYCISCERGLSQKTCLLGKITISDYMKDPVKFTFEAGAKFKVAEFNKRFITLLPYGAYERSKGWHDFRLGAAAFLAKVKSGSLCREDSLIGKTLHPKQIFSYTSIEGSIPLGRKYFTLKTEHLRGMENQFAFCPYVSASLKLDFPIRKRIFPLLFFEQSIGVARKLQNVTIYLQGSFKSLKMPFLGKAEIKKHALKLIPPGHERDKLENELFNKSLLFLKGFAISGGITGGF
jgi:hypothetical protein